MKMQRGVTLTEAVIAMTVVGVAAVIAIAAWSSDDSRDLRQSLVAAQAQEMMQISRAVADLARVDPDAVAEGPQKISLSTLVSKGLLPPSFGARPETGLSGTVSPLGQRYVAGLIKYAGVQPIVQSVVSVDGNPVPAALERAGLTDSPAAMVNFQSEVAKQLRRVYTGGVGLVPAGSHILDESHSGYRADLTLYMDGTRETASAVVMGGFQMLQEFGDTGVVDIVKPSGKCSVEPSGVCPSGTVKVRDVNPCQAAMQAATQYLDPRTNQTFPIPSGALTNAATSGVRVHAVQRDITEDTVGGELRISAPLPRAIDGRPNCGSQLVAPVESPRTITNATTEVRFLSKPGLSVHRMAATGINAAYGKSVFTLGFNGATKAISIECSATTNTTCSAVQTHSVGGGTFEVRIFAYGSCEPGVGCEYGAETTATKTGGGSACATPTVPWDTTNNAACGMNLTAVNSPGDIFKVPPLNSQNTPLEYQRYGVISLGGVRVLERLCVEEKRQIDTCNVANSTWTALPQSSPNAALCCEGEPEAPTTTPPPGGWGFGPCDQPRYHCPDGNVARTCHWVRAC